MHRSEKEGYTFLIKNQNFYFCLCMYFYKTRVLQNTNSHLESIVSAQPSTAISCVAARKFNGKNKSINNGTFGGFESEIKK